ncbi:MAG: shikimate dehydrogenase [Pseudomonadota bacterium]
MATPLAGVIGHPIHHSKSPVIHNHWLRRFALAGAYVPLSVPPDDLEPFLEMAPRLGFVGLNVTIPHKERVAALIDVKSEAANRAGSVNTLWLGEDGAWRGDSTDGIGFIRNIEARSPGWSANGASVAMIGAGGAARAVAAALLEAGAARIRIANRTAARAEALVDALGRRIETAPWPLDTEFFEDADLLINATSLGMAGAADWSWSAPRLQAGVIATDLIYNPLETPFLSAASAAGARIVDGLGMLLHQAAPGFERWFGARPTVDEALRREVLASLGASS